MKPVRFVVLAAGLGKRMGGSHPKTLIKTVFKPIIHHVLSNIFPLDPEKVITVTGFGRKDVERSVTDSEYSESYDLQKIAFAFQKEQLGTGHACQMALPELENFKGTIVITCGDIPLLSSETYRELLKEHEESDSDLTVLSFFCDETNAYGRIVKNDLGDVVKITEFKDCSPEEEQITEVNAGVYAVTTEVLLPALKSLNNNNSQKEFYLTDIISWCAENGKKLSSVMTSDPSEIEGVNTPLDLAKINKTLLDEKRKELLSAGVFLQDPSSFFIEDNASVEAGAIIGPNVILKGNTVIKKGVEIEGNAWIKDTLIEEDALIKFSVRTEDAVIGKNAAIGPFAHLRPQSLIGEEAKVGNFVETKKTTLGKGAKASHLSYLGDTTVEDSVNIGAGTITCNYDGYGKARTTIKEGAFIGSNTCMVAPVTVGAGATTGAGSVITKDVEADALALTRAELKTVSGWSKRKREAILNKKS